jgi:aryl-alcohol dehydrogenase-like predicted oxidoreductase
VLHAHRHRGKTRAAAAPGLQRSDTPGGDAAGEEGGSTILGARTLDQLETNLRPADLHLTAAEAAALDAASDPHPVDYPYGELGVEQRARTLPADH